MSTGKDSAEHVGTTEPVALTSEPPVWLSAEAAYGYECGWDAGWEAAMATVRAMPTEQRMRAMGMVAVGWTYDNSPSLYFCGGPSNDYSPEHPHVYVEHDVAMRKEHGGG